MENGKVEVNALVVGGGLAGTLVAWELAERGWRVVVVDDAHEGAASRVAPGIVNPLAGKRLRPSWDIGRQLPAALVRYAQAEGCFRKSRILRVIRDPWQRAHFEARRQEATAQAYIGEEHAPGEFDGTLNDAHGSFEAAGSGWLDIPEFLKFARWKLQNEVTFLSEAFAHAELELRPTGVRWKGVTAQVAVYCEGWRVVRNPWFDWVPFKPARGEMLDLEQTGGPPLPETIVNRAKWLLPLGDGRFRAGSTYSWSDFDAPPTQEAEREILHYLGELTPARWRVTGRRAGVRSIVEDYRPILGRHPQIAALAVFNGLGSKGVLAGPYLARRLAAYLVDGEALDRETEVSRFVVKGR